MLQVNECVETVFSITSKRPEHISVKIMAYLWI